MKKLLIFLTLTLLIFGKGVEASPEKIKVVFFQGEILIKESILEKGEIGMQYFAEIPPKTTTIIIKVNGKTEKMLTIDSKETICIESSEFFGTVYFEDSKICFLPWVSW